MSKINIRIPCKYKEFRIQGVLDHEIGTHFLRKHNEKGQKWYKKKKEFNMNSSMETEEGLAVVN